MNIAIVVAAALAVFVAFGHFAFGIKWYLKPMLNSEFEKIPKTTMQCVFHYVSAFLTLSAIVLWLAGFGFFRKYDPTTHLPPRCE